MVLRLQLLRDGLARQDTSCTTRLATKGHVVGILEQQLRLVACRQRRKHACAFFGCGTVAQYIVVARACDAQRGPHDSCKGFLRVACSRQSRREGYQRGKARLTHCRKAGVGLAPCAQRGVCAKRVATQAHRVRANRCPTRMAAVPACYFVQHKHHILQPRQQLRGTAQAAQCCAV